MQWSDQRNAGFSRAPEDHLMRPVVEDGPFGFRSLNVEQQQRDPDSLLNWVHRALSARRQCREFGWGRCEFLPIEPNAVETR